MKSKNYRSALWCLPVSFWMTFFYLIPLLFIVATSFKTMENYRLAGEFTLQSYERIFTNVMYWKALRNSLLLSLKVVAVTTLIAYPLAMVLNYAVPKRWRNFFLVLIIAPFWTSYLIRAYSWFIVLGNTGIINTVLKSLGFIEQPVQILYTNTATTIGLVHYLLPLMTLNLYTTLENIDPKLLEAAGDLGANRIKSFWHVILPLSSGGLCNSLMFCFILAFADFISPATLGGQLERVFPQLIVDAVQWNVDWPLAAALSMVMVFAILGVLILISLFRNIGNLENGGSGK
ncbi:MAG: ABC transporter permease [Lutisporaceae bacterium]|jgi:spermidine/putrescine transport system permease protein